MYFHQMTQVGGMFFFDKELIGEVFVVLFRTKIQSSTPGKA